MGIPCKSIEHYIKSYLETLDCDANVWYGRMVTQHKVLNTSELHGS